MAQTIAKLRERLRRARRARYGVIGLGAGSLACHAKPGRDLALLRDRSGGDRHRQATRATSRSCRNCQPKPDIVLGDARLTMAKEANDSFDLIIVDAFSSDAMPVHLMTAEAMRLYLDKLKPDGIVLLHISNRYLDLDSVLGATIKVLPACTASSSPTTRRTAAMRQSTSTVAVFAKCEEALEPLRDLKET